MQLISHKNRKKNTSQTPIWKVKYLETAEYCPVHLHPDLSLGSTLLSRNPQSRCVSLWLKPHCAAPTRYTGAQVLWEPLWGGVMSFLEKQTGRRQGWHLRGQETSRLREEGRIRGTQDPALPAEVNARQLERERENSEVGKPRLSPGSGINELINLGQITEPIFSSVKQFG